MANSSAQSVKAAEAAVEKAKRALAQILDAQSKRNKLSNAAFNKLSDKKKRVQIARDVLVQLDKRKFKGKTGSFATILLDKKSEFVKIKENTVSSYDDDTSDLQLDKVLKDMTSCDVCAIGGLFVCAVERANAITVGDANGSDSDRNTIDVEGAAAFEYLEEFFEREQLDLIEIAFEDGNGWVSSDGKEDELGAQEVSKARRFGRKFDNSTSRLRAIMNNIVHNQGTFIP